MTNHSQYKVGCIFLKHVLNCTLPVVEFLLPSWLGTPALRLVWHLHLRILRTPKGCSSLSENYQWLQTNGWCALSGKKNKKEKIVSMLTTYWLITSKPSSEAQSIIPNLSSKWRVQSAPSSPARNFYMCCMLPAPTTLKHHSFRVLRANQWTTEIKHNVSVIIWYNRNWEKDCIPVDQVSPPNR